ncbi:hypothetical protein ACF0H5_007481 [Mactra antiquata]
MKDSLVHFTTMLIHVKQIFVSLLANNIDHFIQVYLSSIVRHILTTSTNYNQVPSGTSYLAIKIKLFAQGNKEMDFGWDLNKAKLTNQKLPMQGCYHSVVQDVKLYDLFLFGAFTAGND